MKKNNKTKTFQKKSKHQLVEEAALETANNNPRSSSSTTTTNSNRSNQKKKPSDMSVSETSDWIAELSESVLEKPYAAFSSTVIEGGENGKTIKEPSKMRSLLSIASAAAVRGADGDQHTTSTATLAVLSLLAIFKDILPSYRIRLPSTKEMAVKVSKETKTLWDYERALLQHYQEYLKLLQKLWGKKRSAPDGLAITAIISLCELLKSALHFNFRSNLLSAVIRPMNHQVDQVSHACCEAVEFVFANDVQGDVALEASRQVAKMIRERNFKVRPNVVGTFRALPLRVHVDEAEAAKLASKTNAKKRKRDKESAAIEAELRESQATVDKTLLARCQSDTLQTVTLTYFRILKSEDLKASHVEVLLPPTLEGLAKFAHLINIDTVMDLLGVLKSLLKRVDALPLGAALNCVLTAFQTLNGPGREMKIDVKDYILPLYNQLPRLCSEDASRHHTDMMINCLSAAFIKRREFSTTRVAAYFKRILSVSMHAPAHSSVPLIVFARQLLQRYPSAQQLLENEEDAITSGQYNSEVEDPEHSNPFATSAWELATMKFHLHPSVAMQASSAATLKLLQLPAETPEKLRAGLLEEYDELVIPFKRVKKKHPLEPKSENNKKRQMRFLTPRTTTTSLI